MPDCALFGVSFFFWSFLFFYPLLQNTEILSIASSFVLPQFISRKNNKPISCNPLSFLLLLRSFSISSLPMSMRKEKSKVKGLRNGSQNIERASLQALFGRMQILVAESDVFPKPPKTETGPSERKPKRGTLDGNEPHPKPSQSASTSFLFRPSVVHRRRGCQSAETLNTAPNGTLVYRPVLPSRLFPSHFLGAGRPHILFSFSPIARSWSA